MSKRIGILCDNNELIIATVSSILNKNGYEVVIINPNGSIKSFSSVIEENEIVVYSNEEQKNAIESLISTRNKEIEERVEKTLHILGPGNVSDNHIKHLIKVHRKVNSCDITVHPYETVECPCSMASKPNGWYNKFDRSKNKRWK